MWAKSGKKSSFAEFKMHHASSEKKIEVPKKKLVMPKEEHKKKLVMPKEEHKKKLVMPKEHKKEHKKKVVMPVEEKKDSPKKKREKKVKDIGAPMPVEPTMKVEKMQEKATNVLVSALSPPSPAVHEKKKRVAKNL
jgi:hypothetical protein